MGFKRNREQRQRLALHVRININDHWYDATIRNISSRGLMVECDYPPTRGSYVEIRRGRYIIIAQVRWSANRFMGCHARKKIDLSALASTNHQRAFRHTNERRAVPRTPSTSKGRRQSYRRPAHIRSDDAGARSRYAGRLFEFAAIAAALVVLGAFMVDSVHQFVTHPLESARLAMQTNIK